ncbi:MAG: hypothetical protein M3306_17805 [Actinomycetota bacterium]|nr:hypothetical protein [Actinomycetota bacterium]
MTNARPRGSGWAISGLFLVILAGVFVVAGSLAYFIAGIAEQNAMSQTYVVGFGAAGEDCPRGEAFFDKATGESLDCVQAGGFGSGQASLPGYSDEQNQRMTALAAELGADGLSATDQQEIQALADTYAATVPASEQPHYDEGVYAFGLYGTRLAIVSGAVGLLALAAIGGSFWLLARV